MLTESEVQRSFRRLFSGGDVCAETYDKAEALIEELRDESPLRHRLLTEIDEIKRLNAISS